MMAENPAQNIQEIYNDPSCYDKVKTRVNLILNTYPNEDRSAR